VTARCYRCNGASNITCEYCNGNGKCRNCGGTGQISESLSAKHFSDPSMTEIFDFDVALNTSIIAISGFVIGPPHIDNSLGTPRSVADSCRFH
jgi:RecJ-like exonuclease